MKPEIPPDKCKDCLYLVLSTANYGLLEYNCRRNGGCKIKEKTKGKKK